jgi:hypothetical protein
MADPQRQSLGTRSRQVSVSGTVLLLLSTTSLGILTVGNALVLNVLIGEFRLAWLAAMLCFEVASIAAALFFWPSLRPVARWHWLEVVGVIVVGGVFLAHAIHLAPADWMPVSFSVDCSHQHLLVNYIYTHNSLPDNVDYLYIYNDYPVAPSALAAILAHVLGVLPAQTMYPLAALFVTVQVMLAYGISIELLPRRSSSYLLAALAAWMVFLVYPYTVHVFARHFYSNMMMGNLTVLFALWIIAVRERLPPVWTAGVTICLVFGCLNSYPAWLPFIAIPLLTSMLLDRRMSVPKRWMLAFMVLAVTVILTAIALVDQWSFITWFAPSRDRRLTPDWQSLGGVFLILVSWGIWTLARNWKQHLGLVLFLLIDAILVAALYGAAVMDKLTLYMPDKTFYFDVFLFIVLAALGLDQVRARLVPMRRTNNRTACVVMIALGLVVLVGVNSSFPRPTAYPITLDEYQIAYQLAQQMPDVELTYLVRSHATFYWIYGCVLNHTHDLVAKDEQWQANVPTYESWIQDATAPKRALVSDLTALSQEDGRWHVVMRSWNSGVIEKDL